MKTTQEQRDVCREDDLPIAEPVLCVGREFLTALLDDADACAKAERQADSAIALANRATLAAEALAAKVAELEAALRDTPRRVRWLLAAASVSIGPSAAVCEALQEIVDAMVPGIESRLPEETT